MRQYFKAIIPACLCLFVFYSSSVYAQTPANDNCESPIQIASVKQFCSPAGAYSTVGATKSFTGGGNDVWFSYTPRDGYDLYITASGLGNGGTLQSPIISVFTDCTYTEQLAGSVSSKNNSTTYYKGGLVIGNTYLISVSGANSGTFSLCISNTASRPDPGHDCATATYLCSKDPVKALNISGVGANPNEARGTCMDGGNGQNSESNSALYKWTAANNGSLVFTITPLDKNDDIDWVLYDLGITGDCSQLNSGSAIRCAAGSGVNCTPSYYQTGMSLTETDLSERIGCVPGQNGFVKYTDMIEGHVYCLLINNYDNANNGFTLDFTGPDGKIGTGEFVGPDAGFTISHENACAPEQTYTFTANQASGAVLNWKPGGDASVVASTDHSITVHYRTTGTKTVVLEATINNRCTAATAQTIEVREKPVIHSRPNKGRYCTTDTIILITDSIPGLIYSWTGPGNFKSSQPTIRIPANNPNAAGVYELLIRDGDCYADKIAYIIAKPGTMPTAAFSSSPVLPARLQTPAEIRFRNESLNATNYRWDFGDGSSSTESDPAHTYTRPGDYQVSLTAYNGFCIAVLSGGTLIIRNGDVNFIPNTFTPNGDGINDEFAITLSNLATYHISIFNRYGVILFETKDLFENWKGTYKNEAVPVGAYYYLINAVDLTGNPVRRSGYITVLR